MKNLVELKKEELREVDGGGWFIPVLIGVILTDWKEFKTGFSEAL